MVLTGNERRSRRCEEGHQVGDVFRLTIPSDRTLVLVMPVLAFHECLEG
jgi:hypothetical protein